MTIAPVGASLEFPQVIDGPARRPGVSFSDQFANFIKEANTEIHQGEAAAEAFSSGETNNIHETMIAMERASITLHLVGSVRNRILEAYNEVMRMGM